ncbi:MAG TPA: hypothetical protein ENI86_03025 [Acidimicrobiales bacterium]|nr:hypothetical protein [Acidimicrobiales bacterium]
MITVGVFLRLAVSLAIVVGGLLAVRWWTLRSGSGGSRGAIRVLARSSLGRNVAVAVVEVGSKRFLVGTGESGVNLIGELPAGEDLSLTGPDDDIPPSDPVVGTASVGSSLNPDGTGFFGSSQRNRPRIGLLANLRRMTTRVPQQVRIHGAED